MKLTLLLIFLGITQMIAAEAWSQTTKMSLQLKDVAIKQVLDQIEEHSDFFFLYNSKLIDVERKVDVDVKNQKIDEILNGLFQETDVVYTVVDRQIVLTNKADQAGFIQQSGLKITGRVTDQSGQSIPGTTVLVKNTTVGVITDADGKYSVNIPPNSVMLVFSFVGMKSQEIKIGNQTTIDVLLTEETIGLDEVVAIGYGTMKKSDVIGSMSTIKSESIAKMNVTRADQALQGQAAGVMVSQSSGTAGSTPVIKVRGISSINLGTDPLWVIDGVVVGQGFMNNISPDDIASIDVLKDAASTAIYGSRASSGVVLVTTKSGNENSEFTINYRMGISELNYRDIFCNKDDYWKFYDTGMFNDSKGQTQYFDPQRDIINKLFKNGNENMTREEALLENNDWIKILSRPSIRHDLSLSTSKKVDKWQLYGSFNYVDEEGIIKGNDFNRLSGSLKIESEIFTNLTMGAMTNLSYNTANDSYNFSFISRPIWMKPYGDKNINPSGYWNALVTNPWQNPLLITDKNYNKNESLAFNMLSKGWLEYDVPCLIGLSLRSEVSTTYNSNRDLSWSSKEIDYMGKGYASDSNSDSFKSQVNVYGSFDRIIGRHAFTGAAGYEYMEAKGYFTQLSGGALGTDYDFMGVPGEVVNKNSYVGGENKFGSLFGRLNYKLNEKYMAGVSFRRDATYQFSPDTRWSNFAAASLGWIISSEKFFNLEWMNLLKVRGSFGQTGNSNVPGNVRYNTFTYNAKAYGVLGSMDGYVPATLGNDKIKWEKTNSIDAGVDLGFLGNRINGSVAYFEQRIADLILNSPLPPSTGVTSSSMLMNIGKMKNYGIEIGLSSVNTNKSSRIKWTTDFNIAFNKNKVLSLSPELDASGLGIINGPTITKVGESIGTYYMPEYAGIDPEKGVRTIREVDAVNYKAEGVTMFTGNTIMGTAVNRKSNNYIHSGKSGIPVFYGGLTNNLIFRNFDFSVLLTFAGGHYIYDTQIAGWMGDGEIGGGRIHKDLVSQSWEKAGDNSRFPQISYMGAYRYNDKGEFDANKTYSYTGASTEFLYSGNYIRVKNISLGYSLPKSMLMKTRLSNLRLFAAATNLFTITSYDGLDVELQSNSNFQTSVRNNQVPTTRTITIGLNVSF